jgi:hypothetical protein
VIAGIAMERFPVAVEAEERAVVAERAAEQREEGGIEAGRRGSVGAVVGDGCSGYVRHIGKTIRRNKAAFLPGTIRL